MRRPPITTAPAEKWSSYGATGAQKDATVSATTRARSGRSEPNPLPPFAPICREKSMVRRGSTVGSVMTPGQVSVPRPGAQVARIRRFAGGLARVSAMRTDAGRRRKSFRALTTHHPRSALASYPMAHQMRATRRTPGRRSPRLARWATDKGFLGARFWGQMRGSSGRLKVLQGKGGTSGETRRIAGKARYQAPSPGPTAAGRILHGKEGSTVRVRQRASKIPAKRDFLLSELVQPSTSFARRGSRVNGGSAPQRVAEINDVFLVP
jgi:hypothetical protein